MAFRLEAGVLSFCSLLLANHLVLWGITQTLRSWPLLACTLGGQLWGAVPGGQLGVGSTRPGSSLLSQPPQGTLVGVQTDPVLVWGFIFFSPVKAFSSRTQPCQEQPLICPALDDPHEQKNDGMRGLPFAIKRVYQEKKQRKNKERED